MKASQVGKGGLPPLTVPRFRDLSFHTVATGRRSLPSFGFCAFPKLHLLSAVGSSGLLSGGPARHAATGDCKRGCRRKLVFGLPGRPDRLAH
jgi:hypothetical protein